MQQPTQPAPITRIRDHLLSYAERGHWDAIGGRHMAPPQGHRAERRCYVRSYLRMLNAMRAYGDAS